MAQPPEDETHSYSPSKLTALPNLVLTPSSGPLNNSGTYSQAVIGPIIASAAGRSPLDSKMNSPESEEPTIPAFDHTQVGPTTMQALDIALAPLAEHEADMQLLWDNVQSLPADLPPQPEVIEVRGRTTSRTPRVRSRALSNASVWSHATVESVSADGSPDIHTAQFTTALQLLKAGLLGPSYDFDALDSMYIDQGLVPKEDAALTTDIVDTNSTLKEELAREVTEKVIGWGAYHLGAPLQMSNENSFPSGPKTVHAATALTITLIDVGAANHRGELMANGLTPSSWMRLCLGLLAAMIRGALRSPPALTRGNRSLNGNPDPFPKHQDLDVPLTEGGAMMLMTQQLGGLFTSYRNHPDKSYPDSYFEKLITSLDETVNRLEGVGLSVPSAPLPFPTAAAPTGEELWELHFREEMERFRVNAPEMNDVKSDVKKHIFSLLNDEAMANLEEWKAVYKYEFIEAMHGAFEAQYPGIHPGKGKAHANPPPLTLSQVVRDAVPQIQQEVAAQVDARIKDIHNEIRDSLGANDPFWTSGPLQESIAKQVISATTAQIQHNLESETAALKLTADEELAALKSQCQHEYPLKLEDFKAGVWDMCKDWKAKYNNARSLHTLRDLAHKRGFALTPLDPLALQRETDAFKTYALDPLTVDGFELSSSLPSRAHSPVTDKPHTPPNIANPLFLPDPNVTPTQVRVKRIRTEDLPPSSPIPYPPPLTHLTNLREAILWSSSSPARAKALPLPPTPMEEDFNYALENSGIYDSDHAPAPIAQPTPLPAHNPSAPPQVVALATQAEQPTTAHVPVTVAPRPSELVDLPSAPPAAAPSRDPRPKPTKAQSAKAREAVAAPPAPNTAKALGPPAMDETLSHVARVDDPAGDPIVELFTEGASTVPITEPTIVREAFQPPADKIVRLETDARGRPLPTTTMPVSWAGVVTQKAAHQQATAAAHAKSTNQTMGRTTGGKSCPETAARRTANANTDVMVICGHGVDDPLFELQLFKRAPSTFVAEI
ncbi:hypothetical protein EDB84DRAFT_1437439 [Lactarius hengduanensis]|nr:hypothetical protein EDB84DRAFT_1437439 [Lactarius hengduanensis]